VKASRTRLGLNSKCFKSRGFPVDFVSICPGAKGKIRASGKCLSINYGKAARLMPPKKVQSWSAFLVFSAIFLSIAGSWCWKRQFCGWCANPQSTKCFLRGDRLRLGHKCLCDVRPNCPWLPPSLGKRAGPAKWRRGFSSGLALRNADEVGCLAVGCSWLKSSSTEVAALPHYGSPCRISLNYNSVSVPFGDVTAAREHLLCRSD